MTRSAKIVLFAVGGAAGLVILVVAAATLLLRANLKSRVEAVASKALDMEVNVGRAAIEFFPPLSVALADVHVRQHGAEVASAAQINLGLEFLPLLHKKFRISAIAVKELRIALERGVDGKLNVAGTPTATEAMPQWTVLKASISDATMRYTDKKSGSTLQAAGCNLDVSRLLRSQGESTAFLKSLSFAVQLDCTRLSTKDFAASDVKMAVDGQQGIFNFAPVTMRLIGGRGSGNVRADFSGAVPIYRVRYELAQLRIEEFFKGAAPKQVGTGSMDFATTLSLRGTSLDALKRSAEGQASLHGENLSLQIGDLDKKFARYESSQNFNLVDLGAFFFVGPLGLGITKGLDFARVLEDSGDNTRIPRLVSKWKVEHGVAQAIDVAMATPGNRVALKGGLNFVSGRFDDVTVALIDTKGCARVQQKIHGPFRQPQVEKPNVLRALAGPTAKLLRQAKDLFGGSCEVFYAGSVVAP